MEKSFKQVKKILDKLSFNDRMQVIDDILDKYKINLKICYCDICHVFDEPGEDFMEQCIDCTKHYCANCKTLRKCSKCTYLMCGICNDNKICSFCRDD